MHELLTEKRPYKRAVEEASRKRRRASRLRDLQQAAAAQHREALAAHEAAVREALDTGEPMPPRPAEPETDHELIRSLTIESMTANDPVDAVCRGLAPGVLREIDRRAAELESIAADALGILDGLVAEARSLVSTAGHLRGLAGLPPLVERGQIDAALLLHLVATGRGLVEASRPVGGSAVDAASVDGSPPARPEPTFRVDRLAGRR